MTRRSSAPARAPKLARQAPLPGAPPPDDQRVPLRLTITRGVLGLELYEPVALGPLEVSGLAFTLPNLSFPVDLSGGVARVRHRRGDLERVTLTLSFAALGRFLSPRLRQALPGAEREVVWGRSSGIGIGVAGGGFALAFDLLWAPSGGDARFIVSRARAVGLSSPALGHALRIADTVLGDLCTRRGRLITIEGVGGRIGKVLLPPVGARVPNAGRVRFGDVLVETDRAEVELDAELTPPALGVDALREVELARLVEEADERLAAGDVEAARAAYVHALERGPRQPDVVRMIAEIDARVGGRGEAALGLLVESLPAERAGLVGAELLAKIGELSGARAALRESLRDEPFAPLAALAWCRLAALESDVVPRHAALDAAVARAPSLPEARWARFEARLARGDLHGALADAEHLEALYSGARARYDACSRSARALLDQNHVKEAGRLFERALRYVPDDAAATAGLARALMQAGKKDRAVALLERAIELGERRGAPDPHALVDLAVLLAEHLDDLPQAIARVREVPSNSVRALEARRLEALWRSRLGDVAGASLAYGRMREAVELGARAGEKTADWLAEAGAFEWESRREPAAAERHLALALRLSPHDPVLLARYREVSADVIQAERRRRHPRDE
jgi:tetratricopeptide (TPR) repeat protein